MKIHILKHHDDAPAGLTYEYVLAERLSWSINNMSKNEPLPDLNSFDFLIVLGGGMNVHEEDKYSWLKQEKEFIREAVQKNKFVLGLCLGGQLLAEVLGGAVEKNQYQEIGFHPVHLQSVEGWEFLKSTSAEEFFHYHSYKFSLPPEARALGSSEATPYQGFVYKDRVLALQFHPEATMEWVDACASDVVSKGLNGPYIEDPSNIRNSALENLPKSKAWYFNVLDSMRSAFINQNT